MQNDPHENSCLLTSMLVYNDDIHSEVFLTFSLNVSKMLKLGSQVFMKSFFNFVKLPVTKRNPALFNVQPVRHAGFFNKLTQAELWKGVLSVSNAGRRKGRARSLPNINKVMRTSFRPKPGEGKIRMSWPGLNRGVLQENELVKIQELPKVEEEKPISRPVVLGGRTMTKIHPLDRGWSGRKKLGVKLGPPNPEESVQYDNFESIAIYIIARQAMASKLGRKKKYSVIVATGNGNGLIGFGKSYKQEQKGALNLAKAKAAKRLIAIDLIEKHTVNHDFYSKYGRTRVFVSKQPKGYGLRCHRVIKAICQLVGIENLYAKVEGPSNIIHLIRAFVTGLVRQKTYEQMANEKKLHLVEFKEETFNFPKVLASPQKCLTEKELPSGPVLFEEYLMNGKLIYRPDPKVFFYQRLPSWETHLKRTLYHRNHEKVRIDLMAKYGSCRSHLADIYPECQSTAIKKKANSESE